MHRWPMTERSCLSVGLSCILVFACNDDSAPVAQPEKATKASAHSDTAAQKATDASIRPHLANISEVRGTVHLGTGAAHQGDRVLAGTRIRTQADGFCTVEFITGSELRMMPQTSIVVGGHPTQPKAARIILALGHIWNRVAAFATGDENILGYEVHTVNAVAGVRGTEFNVAVGLHGQTTVRVNEGTVDVHAARDSRDKKSSRVKLGAGTQVRVKHSEDGKGDKLEREDPTRMPLPATADEVASWYDKQLETTGPTLVKVAQRTGQNHGQASETLKGVLSAIESIEHALQNPSPEGDGTTIANRAASVGVLVGELIQLTTRAQRLRAVMESSHLFSRAVAEHAARAPEAVGGIAQVQALQAVVDQSTDNKTAQDLTLRLQVLDTTTLESVVRKHRPGPETVASPDAKPVKDPQPEALPKPTVEAPPKTAKPTARPKRKQAPSPAPVRKNAPAPTIKKTTPKQPAVDNKPPADMGKLQDALDNLEDAARETTKTVKLPQPDGKRDWQTPAEVQTAADALCGQMEKIAAMPPAHIALAQKAKALRTRLGILRLMGQALPTISRRLQRDMRRAKDPATGMRLFQELQAAKILQQNLDERLRNWETQVRGLERKVSN